MNTPKTPPRRKSARSIKSIANVLTALAALCALASALLYTQTRAAGTTFYSQGSLPPEVLASWNTQRNGSGTPPASFTNGDTFVIQNTHSMSTASPLGWTVSGAGATVEIESGGTLTANAVVSVPNFQIDNGGAYVHNAASGSANGSSADIPGSASRTFGANGSVTVKQWANGGTSPAALPNVSWGNLTIDVASLGGSWQQSGAVSAVQGSLDVKTTGGSSNEFVLTSGGALSLNVGGNLTIEGGILDLSNGAGATTLDLAGNYSQTAGTLTDTGSSASTFDFNGGASLVTFNQSGGTLNDAEINWSIASGKTVQFGVNANSLNFTNAASRTFTINQGGTLLDAVQINNSGAMNVNGEFRLTDGGFATGNAFTYGANGTLGFVSSGPYGVGDDAYWPTTNGPANVTVLGGGITMNVARTVGGLFQYSAGVFNMGNLTLNGTSQVNTGGFAVGSPTYGPSSLLKYNIDSPSPAYGRNGEWLPNVTSGAGYPANVQLSNNTNLDLPGGSSSASFQMSGSLTIDSGATLNLNGSPAMTQPLSVLGDLSLGGTLALSSATGGDFRLGGNWTRAAAGTFTPNSRAVFFDGAGAQTVAVTGGGTQAFDFLVVDKSAGSLSPSSAAGNVTSLSVNATSGNVLQLVNAGGIDLNGQTLTLSGDGGNLLVSGGARTVSSSSGTGTFAFNGAKTVTSASGGTLSFAGAVNVNVGDGVDFGAGLSTVNGTLSIKSGGFVNTNPPAYATGSTLEYDNGTSYNSAAEFPSSGVQNVNLASTTQLNLNGDKSIAGTFALNDRTLALGGNKLTTAGTNAVTVGSGGSVTRTSGYIIGTEQKTFAGPASFTFDVGTANGYSPVDANSTTGAGTLSVKPTQTKQPNVPGTNTLSRYWTLTGTGSLTTNLTFHYLAGDVVGTESNYKIFKYAGTFTQFTPTALDTTNHFATLNGVSSFSDWTLGEPSSLAQPLSGTKTVCASGCDYTSLTGAAPGGVFADINANGLSGNLVVSIAGDLTESGTNALNQWTETPAGSNFTVTIQPDSATLRTISGSVAGGMIRLSGANRVTFDGRFNGAGRFLLFRNTINTGATFTLVNDASNDTICSCFIEGRESSTSAGVVFFSTGATTGNDNDTIADNQIRDLSNTTGVPVNLIFSGGSSPSVANSNNTVSNNEMFNFTNRGVNVSGINAGTSDSWTITGNNVYQTAPRGGSLFGISVGAAGSNTITGNTVHDLTTGGFIARGINFVPTGSGTSVVSQNRVYAVASTSDDSDTEGIGVFANDTSTVTVVNNMVSIIPSGSNDQEIEGLLDQGAGGTTVSFFYNSVIVGGTASGANNLTWACLKNFDSAHTSRDNIFFNSRTGGGSNNFAAGDRNGGGTFSSDYNLFAGTGATAAAFFDTGTDDPDTGAPTPNPVTFSQWQTATGGDSHSRAGNPDATFSTSLFVNPATGDLHVNTGAGTPTLALVANAGTPVAGVTTDFDNDARNASTPDIGADEFNSPLALTANNALTVTSGATGTIDSTKLQAAEAGAPPQQLTFTVQTAPSHGTLFNNSVALTSGGTFTQADINNNLVTYANSGDSATADSFDFTASDGAGGSIGLTTFNIDVTTLPTLSIDDVTQAEGDSGTTAFVFHVTKTGAGAASVNFDTADGTATVADNDYQTNSGTLNFASGDTVQTITVLVNGDTRPELDETFSVNLTGQTGATVARGTGTGTIQNNDESASAGQLLISEFRLRGPGPAVPPTPASVKSKRKALSSSSTTSSSTSSSSPTSGGAGAQTSAPTAKTTNVDTSAQANDEFVELYNATDSPLFVTTTDGSKGWALAASDGVVRFVVPAGTTIPARGHFLGVNTLGYSLGSYPAGDDGSNETTATGDPVLLDDGTPASGYTLDIPDNAGIAVFRTATPANFSAATRLDAAGSTAEANPLYKEGAGYPALAPADISKNLEGSFYRSLCSFVSGVGCTTPGVPKNTGDNSADFLFVDTKGTPTAAGQRLGAPGPEGLSSPVQRNSSLGLDPLDRSVANSLAPNRVRDPNDTSDPNTKQFGTLSIRRRVTNNTGSPVTRLRFRVVEVTTFPPPGGIADLRALTSPDVPGVSVGDAGTCGGPTPCTVTVKGTTLEEPPAQSSTTGGTDDGGGFNSSLTVGSVTLAQPLQPGQSVNVQFLLGVEQTGTFRFLVNIEALP